MNEQLRLIDVPAVCGVGDEETQRRAMREWLEKNPPPAESPLGRWLASHPVRESGRRADGGRAR